MPFHTSETEVKTSNPRSYHEAIHERAPADIVGAQRRRLLPTQQLRSWYFAVQFRHGCLRRGG